MYEKIENIVALVKESIAGDKRNGNLAFLLLTSKSEHYIRDKVALKLRNSPRYKRLLVAREWGSGKGKIDLAVLHQSNPHKPVLLIELKTNNLGSHIMVFKNDIKHDIEKLDKYCKSGTDCFIIFTSLLLNREISDKYASIVKYFKGINAFTRNKSYEARTEWMVQLWSNLIYRNYKSNVSSIVTPRIINAGKFCNNAEVSLLIWAICVTGSSK